MGYYSVGLSVTPQEQGWYRRGVAVGALIATPGNISDEANRLNSDVESMDAQMSAERRSWNPPGVVVQEGTDIVVFAPEGSGKSPGDSMALTPQQQAMDRWYDTVWSPWKAEWAEFHRVHGTSWGFRKIWENFWGSTWEEVQDFRKALIDMRASAERVGYTFIGPKPAEPKKPPIDEAVSELWKLFKTILYVGIALTAGYAIWRIAFV